MAQFQTAKISLSSLQILINDESTPVQLVYKDKVRLLINIKFFYFSRYAACSAREFTRNSLVFAIESNTGSSFNKI